MIDWTKPVETDEENPRPVRVLCTDGPRPRQVICLMLDSDHIERFDIEGYGYGHRLRNASNKALVRSGWVNIYPSKNLVGRIGEAGDIFIDELAAKAAAVSGCAATVCIEWEEVPNDA